MTEETFIGERIAKYLARAGIASRREVERMIADGRIKVNGKQLDTPAFKVTGKEKIEVDGKLVEAAKATKLWRYHKPSGLVTTHSDPEGRETVFERLPKKLGRVISIGRLDLTSEGLLLLTNDGELARALELPSTGWTRKYRARAFGSINNDAIAKLKGGITVEGVTYGAMEVEVERETGSNVWLTIGLREGKNREIRRALEAVGLQVNRLIRIAYGPFQLGDMGRDEVKQVPARILKDQCGHLLSDETIYEDKEEAVKPAGKFAGKRPSGQKSAGQKFGGQKFGGPGQPGRAKPKNFIDDVEPKGRKRGGKTSVKAASKPGSENPRTAPPKTPGKTRPTPRQAPNKPRGRR